MKKATRSIQIRNDENTSEGITRLFDSAFYADFRNKYVHPDTPHFNDENLKQILISASEKYIWKLIEYEDQIPENLENAALERVNNGIWELYDALLDLTDMGKADKKLTAEIQHFGNYPPMDSARILFDLQKEHPSQSAFYFREMLMDLLRASEQAQNIQENFENTDSGIIWLNVEEKQVAEKERWKKRRAESRLSKSAPLLSFLSDWKPFWEKHSFLPFTEGRYVKELGTTKSQAVDALEEVFALIDTSVTRSAIVSAVKKTKRILNRKSNCGLRSKFYPSGTGKNYYPSL